MTALIMACGAGSAVAQSNAELLDRIKQLETRISELEKTNAPAAKPGPLEAWLGATKFSGYASASYLYNFNRPSGLAPNNSGATDYTRGRSFDGGHNEFALNKLKLVLEKPVEFSGEKWDAGYRADLIFGQDATLLQSAGLNLGTHGDLRFERARTGLRQWHLRAGA